MDDETPKITTLESMICLDDVKGNQNIYCVMGSHYGTAMQVHMDTNEELAVAPTVVLDVFRPARGEVNMEQVFLMFPNPVRTMATGLGMVRSVLGDDYHELASEISRVALGALMEKLGLTPGEMADLLDNDEEEESDD